MCCMKIINYNNCEFVEFNHSVSVLDLQTNEKFHCMIVPTLTSEMFESVVNEYGNNGEIFKFPNSGKVWYILHLAVQYMADEKMMNLAFTNRVF